MDPQSIVVIIGLLGACLVALLLVLLARREADGVRARVTEEVAEAHERVRAILEEAEQRSARASSREADSVIERDALRSQIAEVQSERERLADERKALTEHRARLTESYESALSGVSGLSVTEARAEQLARVLSLAEADAATLVRRIEAKARKSAEAKARAIVMTAVQRVAVPTSTVVPVSIVPLPSEDMKGRIIGKEGRNIRYFEALTGVNVLVDEVPGSVVLSCFDAARREVAQAALESLMVDGRIHPQRIDEAFAQASIESAERTEAAGHDAAERAGVDGLDPAVINLLGELRHRTSYGQSVLEHLVETAQLAAAVAAEIGADVSVSRRAGLLHDIGKALAATDGRSHAIAGADFCARHGETPEVTSAIASHHDEIPTAAIEGVVVRVADAISAARPGARREDVAQYVERLENIEKLASEFRGVRKALVMASGREVRVVVEPDEVRDADLPRLADVLAQAIKTEMVQPGEIHVTVVRELRATAVAG